MPVVLIGRTVQGFGTGALAALCYAFIRFVYPEPLWPKASTLYAAIWGCRPSSARRLAASFAHDGAWRYAFAVLVAARRVDGGAGAAASAAGRGRPRTGKDACRADLPAAWGGAAGQHRRSDRDDDSQDRADRRFGRRRRRHARFGTQGQQPAAAVRRGDAEPSRYHGSI